MSSPYVYDKAKYHGDTIAQHGLPEEHAANHTVFFLRWLVEHGMMSTFFVEESGDMLRQYQAGDSTIHQLYESWDCCLIDDMLSDEGNAFAMHYFDFSQGAYIGDYVTALQGNLPTEFHIVYSDENYQKLRPVIERRYSDWKNPKKRRWWPF